MSGTQGVILVMVGVLLLYLMWSSRSPLNRPSASGGTDPTGSDAQTQHGHEVT